MSHLLWGPKHPDDTDWFAIDWTDVVGLTDEGEATNDVIDSVSWECSDDLTQEATLHSGYETRVKLSGGVSGGYYDVACTVNTNQGRSLTRTGHLIVRARE